MMLKNVWQSVGQAVAFTAPAHSFARHARRAGFVVFALILAVVGVVSVQAHHAKLDPATSLQNPGFEGVYVPFNGDTTRVVAPSWTPWNLGPATGDPTYVNQTPVYRLATVASRIHSGSGAQEYFTLYATHTAGLWQQVSVPIGSQLHFSAYLSVWSGDNDDPNHSANTGGVTVQVGIDPNGGTDATAAGIAWSAPQEYYDQYKQLSVNSAATSNTITVFIRSAVKTAVKHNNVFVDDAALQIQPPSATPAPTGTPVLPSVTPSYTIPPPTATRTLAVTNTPTATILPPTATFTPIATNTPTQAGFATPTREGTIPPTETPGGPTDTLQPTIPTDTPQPLGSGVPTASDTPAVAPTFSGPGITYTVEAGDTVYDLAIRFGTTTDAIIQANGLNSDGFIVIGQVLIIPVVATPIPTLAPPTGTPFVYAPTANPPPGGYLPPGMTGPTVNGIGTYIVQPGDTFYGIASLYHTTPQALARLNGIVNIASVHVGQVLAVPGPGNNVGGQPPNPITPHATYVVKTGDNLFRISLRFNITLAALMNANGIVNPNLIYVGQQLIIPG
ncbi:MAG: LysM peptidoglycan-binding domain-containing protein [Aggregatilineales bacterium]